MAIQPIAVEMTNVNSKSHWDHYRLGSIHVYANFMVMHPKIVEIFQSGPELWLNRLTDRMTSLHTSRTMHVAKNKVAVIAIKLI